MPAKKKRRVQNTNLKNSTSTTNNCTDCGCHLSNSYSNLQKRFQIIQKELTSLKDLQALQLKDLKELKELNKTNKQQRRTATMRDTQLKDQVKQIHNLVQDNLRLRQQQTELKKEVKKGRQSAVLADATTQSLSQSQSALADVNEQIQELKRQIEFERQEGHSKLRIFQQQQNSQLLRAKTTTAKAKEKLKQYKASVDPRCVTPNQINRLAYSVVRYMKDREFSHDQMSLVVAKITKEHFSGDHHTANLSKFQTSRRKSALQTNSTDMAEFLANAGSVQLRECLPLNFLDELRREGAQKFADQLYCHWNVVQCANLKMTIKLSRRKWEFMRKILFMTKRKNVGWCRLWFDGVKVPCPVSHTHIANWMDVVANSYDLTEYYDGRTATIDLRSTLNHCLEMELNRGFFYWSCIEGQWTVRSNLTGTKPVLQIVFDAAGTLKYRKTTAVAFKIANGTPESHKPQFTHTVACSEGGDAQEDLIAGLGGVFTELNELIENPTASVTREDTYTEQIEVDVIAGADQAAVHANFGLCGCNRKFSCPLCHCSNDEFTKIHSNTDHQRRSLHLIRLLAHTVEGECPACKLTIVSHKPTKKNETPLAKPGMKDPKVPPEFARMDGRKKTLPSHTDLHYGVLYGSEIVLQIEPDLFAICILHLNLRMVGNMLKMSMFSNLNKGQGKKAEALWELLVRLGIPIRQVKCTKDTSVVDWFKTISSHSFAGADAARMLVIWEKALEIVFPADEVARGSPELKTKVAAYKSVWSQYCQIWSLLNDLTITKEAKATELEKKSPQFALAWRTAFGSTPTLYMHLLLDHVPSQLRSFPIDLWYLQTEGLEHCNKMRKQFAALMTNGHKPGNQHLIHVDSYKNRFGKLVVAHTKHSGPALSYQLMKNTSVWEHLQSLLAEPDDAESFQQRREAKIKLKQTFKADVERLAAEYHKTKT